MNTKMDLRRNVLVGLFLGLGLLLPGCNDGGGRSSPTGEGGNQAALTGVWGGNGIAVTVTAGGATIEFDCAHGTISQPLTLDASGHFSTNGIYVQEHGGPIAPGPQDSHAALYRGTVQGGAMSLTVSLTDTAQTVGTFTAVLGAAPRVVKCL